MEGWCVCGCRFFGDQSANSKESWVESFINADRKLVPSFRVLIYDGLVTLDTLCVIKNNNKDVSYADSRRAEI